MAKTRKERKNNSNSMNDYKNDYSPQSTERQKLNNRRDEKESELE